MRLLPANTTEIYSLSKSENPDVHNGSSTVALLRAKWCVPVSSGGSHNICVCTSHQKVKLMLSILDHTLDYKEVLKPCVCNIMGQRCMLYYCDNCTDPVVIKDILTVQLLKNRQFH